MGFHGISTLPKAFSKLDDQYWVGWMSLPHFHVQFFMHVVKIYGFRLISTFPHAIFHVEFQIFRSIKLSAWVGWMCFPCLSVIYRNAQFISTYRILWIRSDFHGVRWVSTFTQAFSMIYHQYWVGWMDLPHFQFISTIPHMEFYEHGQN